jgi:hypothetical protein
MTRYREYRGLSGEKVRVPAHTIAQTSRHYEGGSFPYVEMAQGLGKDRDRFAQLALYNAPFYGDAMRDRAAAPFRAAYRAAQA